MSLQSCPSIPVLPPKLGAFRARRDRFAKRIATCVTAIAALACVLIVAAAAVVAHLS